MKKILSGNFRLILYDQTYFDFSIKTLLFHLIDQDRSLNGFNDQNNTNAEKLKDELNYVFTKTEKDTFQKLMFLRNIVL